MSKITYWMRKLGMLRTSSYKVSGDVEKLNDVHASDGGMIQGQKEIDDQYKAQNERKEGHSDNNQQ